MRIAFVIPTKDRPRELSKMLDSLINQTRVPDQLIVVDASEQSVKDIVDLYSSNTPVKYVRWTKGPSAAAQRNAGINNVYDDIDLVCFFDDDQVLQKDALEEMLKFWENCSDDVGGASFNLANYMDDRPSKLKKSTLSNLFGLYCKKPGSVASSGWQSLYGKVYANMQVEWMGSGASVWRHNILKNYKFDDFFSSYSYLEDLEFSYSVSRKYRLLIIANALFEHYPSPGGRISQYHFGIIEVRNRLYFVRKHGLSLISCYTGLIIRFFMSAIGGIITCNKKLIERAIGNVIEICFGRI